MPRNGVQGRTSYFPSLPGITTYFRVLFGADTGVSYGGLALQHVSILLQRMFVGPGTGSSSGHPGGPLACGTTAAQMTTMGSWPTRGGPTPSPQVWPWFCCHCQEVAPLPLSPQTPKDRCDAAPAPTRSHIAVPWAATPTRGGLGGLAAPAGTLPSPLTAVFCSHLPEDHPSGHAQGAGGGWEQLLRHTVHRGASTGCAPGTLPLLRGPAGEPAGHAGGEDT